MNKKAQVKMFESIAVLIIFFFLLSFGFTFYGKMQKISNEKKIRKSMDIDAVSLAIKASNLPELQCSTKNVAEPNCYDELKLVAFRQMLQNKEGNNFLTDHYYQLFGFSTIKLHIIYPVEKYEIMLYDRPRTNETESAGILTLLPISIFNPKTNMHKFGYLNVTYYPSQ